jgi:DNA modification methylase
MAQPLTDMLKAKSRRRRETLTALTACPEPARVRNDLIPRLEFVELDIAALTLPKRNVRTPQATHIREVASAISTLGFIDPVLVDGEGVVLDGVVRVEAARLLGLSKIPCIRADHLTASERRLVRLAVNRLNEKGAWDFDELKVELDELILEGAPIEITGFSQTEIDQITLAEDITGIEVGPLAAGPEANAVARIGDVFVLGEHRVICGDSRDPDIFGRLMAEDQARLILTDVPYNVEIGGHVTKGPHREFVMASGEMSDAEFVNFNSAWIAACLPHLCDGGLFGTFIDWRGYAAVTTAAVGHDLVPINLIVWAKSNAGLGSLYRSGHELLPLLKKGTAPHINNVQLGRHGRWRSNVWTYPGASSLGSDARKGLELHPTVKPVSMLQDALLDITERGDIVLDPFLGSGSTLLAAEKTRRRCCGVELDPLYVDVIVRRYEAVTGHQATLESTGETLATLAVRRRIVHGEDARIYPPSGSDQAAKVPEPRQGERPIM